MQIRHFFVKTIKERFNMIGPMMRGDQEQMSLPSAEGEITNTKVCGILVCPFLTTINIFVPLNSNNNKIII